MLKKIKDSLENYFETKIWHFILLVASSIYVIISWTSIKSFTSLDANSLIFVIWIMLLLYPLFSEMEMFGIRLKKEVEQVKKTVDNIVVSIGRIETMYADIKNAHIYSAKVPESVDKVNTEIEHLKNSLVKIENSLHSSRFTCTSNPVIDYGVIKQFERDQKSLFSSLDRKSIMHYMNFTGSCFLDVDVCRIKHDIYERLVSIVKSNGFYDNCTSIFPMLEYLNRAGIITDNIALLTTTLLNVIDYAMIHGWTSDMEKGDCRFVRDSSIVVLCKLDEALNKE